MTLRRLHLPWPVAVDLHAAVIETLADADRDDLVSVGAVPALTASMTGPPTVEVPGDAAVALGRFCTAFAACHPVLAALSQDLDPDLSTPRIESVTAVPARSGQPRSPSPAAPNE